MNVTKKQIRDLLGQLGKTPEEVRKSLKRRKVKGYLRHSMACPIALYLEKKTKSKFTVSVGGAYVCVDGLDLKTPAPVRKFIANFDSGAYPELSYPVKPVAVYTLWPNL